MKQTFRLSEEISKGMHVRKHVTTKIEYFCESEKDRQILTTNITNVLMKNLGDTNLAKITYDYDPHAKKMEVEIMEHIG